MLTYTILATGQSLTDEDIEYVKTRTHCIAISDAGLLKAPWAEALVSHDSNWWACHPEAVNFKGRKFSSKGYPETEKFDPRPFVACNGVNSGLMGMLVAREIFKAERLILLGFDMHGTHFFGAHTASHAGRPLVNSDESHFKRHIEQFKHFKGCEVVNCTHGSALKIFSKANLRDIL